MEQRFGSPDGRTRVDPKTVSLRVLNPWGVVSEFTYPGGALARVGDGHYRAEVLIFAPGTWRFTWTTTEPDVIGSDAFEVEEPVAEAAT